ncbi:fibronectin type III domain-containing protein [Carboxylicivirga taeanensis]|uniref:fibronectin type III domain-containing protein n=1 Tax=Carboxylicivirga taeanensis TaxID=1416875 RepID=UPI003F6DDAF9
MKTRILFIFLLAAFYMPLKAQNHPVKVVVQAMPPYLVRLADYTTATEPRVYVQLLLADMQQGSRQVRLHVSLTGNNLNIQSTQLQQGSNPYVIYSGQPLRLSNMDMQALFRYENLQGLTPAQYREPLPEGFYKLGFTVYDHITGLPLSQRTEVPLFLTLSNPPVLNLPSRGESVQATTVPNLFFNWSPRHQGLGNVQYEFSLVEIWDDYLSPEQAFLAATPLWTEVTRSNSLLYNLSKPPLQEGKRYAWRVRAFTGDVNNSEALFKNNGCSEIFYFTYTVTCEAPMYLLSHITGARSVTVQWQEAAHFDHYRLQYRKVSYKTEEVTRRVKNKETGERERITTTEEVREVSAWFEVNTPNTQTRLSNLEENTEYEYRVGGHCRNNADQQSFTYSIIQRFTTPSRDDSETAYQCGVLPKIELDNAEPLITLAVNESFMAGDFPVTVTEVNGGKGTYTGRGYIVVPYLADTRLEVSFNGIFINSQYQMLRGMIETAYDASGQNIVSTGEVSNLLDGNQGKKEHQVDFEIADIQYYPETGRVAIIGTNGEKVVLTGADSYEVVDATGKVYHINQDGVQVAGEQSPNGKPDAQTTQGISTGSNGQAKLTSLNRSSGVAVRFVANASQLYGFDAVATDAPDELKALYTQVEGEYLPCKSVVYRQTDFIDFVVEGIVADSVEFVTLNTGRVIQATGNTLTLDGIEQYGSETILARCSSKLAGGDTLQQHMVIGAFELVYLPGEKHIDLTVIPTNGREVPGLELEQTLNAIYKSVGVRFNITVDKAYTAPYEQLNEEESAFYANYTGEQKAIINDYRSRRPVNPNHYYVFYSNITRNTGSAQELGYMPIQRQFGFIYTGGNSQTLAHELAHGVFHLRHTFSSSNETVIPQGHTENLMDYTNGKVLFKYQWEKIHNPDIVLFTFLEGDEEGALKGNSDTEKAIHVIEKIRCAYKTDRKVKFEKDTWKWFSETVTVTNFSDLYDNQTYDYIFIELSEDVNELEIPSNLTFQTDKSYVAQVFRGDVVKFDFGELIIKVDKSHGQALLDYLTPNDTDFEKQKIQFVQRIIDKYKNSDYTRKQVISLLSTSSQCLFEHLTQEQRIALLHLINDGSNIPETVERIVVDIIRTTPENQIEYLFDKLYNDGLMAYFDNVLHDVGGEKCYSRFIIELTDLYFMKFSTLLSDCFSTDEWGNIFIKVTTEQNTWGNLKFISQNQTPYFRWSPSCDVPTWRYGTKGIEIDNFITCGDYNNAKSILNPFEPIVIYLEKDLPYFKLGDSFEDKVIAMPAFVLMWLRQQASDKALAEMLNEGVTIYSSLATLGSTGLVTKGVPKAFLTAWNYFIKVDALMKLLLVNDDVKNAIKKVGQNNEGEEFLKLYDSYSQIFGYIIKPSLEGTILKQKVRDVLTGYANIGTLWDVVKMNTDVKRRLSDTEIGELSNYLNQIDKILKNEKVVE